MVEEYEWFVVEQLAYHHVVSPRSVSKQILFLKGKKVVALVELKRRLFIVVWYIC